MQIGCLTATTQSVEGGIPTRSVGTSVKGLERKRGRSWDAALFYSKRAASPFSFPMALLKPIPFFFRNERTYVCS